MKYALLLLPIAALGLMPQMAQANYYETSSQTTNISFQELSGSMGTGFYRTKMGSRLWVGDFQVASGVLNSNSTIKTYTTSFTDSATGPGPAQNCKGTIKLERSMNTSPATLKATWTITGGVGCPSPVSSNINPPITLSLKETIPVANPVGINSGDFQASNSNIVITETAGLRTWPKWIVADPDPLGLICRANFQTNPTAPGPIVVSRFLPGSIVDVQYLGLDSFITSGGKSWLRVQMGNKNTKCFIRASKQFIKPQPMQF